MRRVVTIDGPAGAGKSTVARTLADRLRWRLLDTGAMYRAVTLAGLRRGTDLRDETALSQLLTGLTLDLPPGQVLLNGEDVTAEAAPGDEMESTPVELSDGLQSVGTDKRRHRGRHHSRVPREMFERVMFVW